MKQKQFDEEDVDDNYDYRDDDQDDDGYAVVKIMMMISIKTFSSTYFKSQQVWSIEI